MNSLQDKGLLEKQKEELASKEKTILWQAKIINQLINDRDKWHIKFNETLDEYHKAIDEYKAVINSPFWKVSEPVRGFLDSVRGLKKTEEGINTSSEEDDQDVRYKKWIENNEEDVGIIEKLEYEPLISVIVPVYNVESRLLKECIASVENQTYQNWQLILVDDHSSIEEVRDVLKEYEYSKKIRVIYRDSNGGISAATNTGIRAAEGEFIGFLDCDDLLSINALYEVAKLLNEGSYDFIYSDEDKVMEDSTSRFMPFFKPDWSPDTILWSNYTNHFSVYRKSIADEVGYFDSELDGAQDHDFVLRFSERIDDKRIGHISKVLYHWRAIEGSTSYEEEAKPYVLEAEKKTKLRALDRRRLDAWLDENDRYCPDRIVYRDHGQSVSIVIPSKDNYEILKRCIDSIYAITDYDNFDVVVVDNGSSVENKKRIQSYLESKNIQYVYDECDFNFSYMCNLGAKNSKGDYLLFLNDDTQIIQKDWLRRMLGQASQEKNGAVGAKMLYPGTNLIQHCGVVNYSYGPSHYFGKCDDDIIYYFYRNKANYNVIAVTAACLMVKREKFNEAGGFNESLPNNYNDVDLCFRLFDHGYYNIVLNDVTMYHHESLSRGDSLMNDEKMKALIKDRNLLYKFNRKYLMYDPFYNINLSQQDNMFGIDVF